MSDQFTHANVAEWIPRDENGRFIPGFTVCRECDGSGTVSVLGWPNQHDSKEVPEWGELEIVGEDDCRRCDGLGAEHAAGCPRCGEDMVDHGVMPCSGYLHGCSSCGFEEVVG